MRKIIALFFIIISYSCDKGNAGEDNIVIKNSDLKTEILKFNENAKYHTGRNTDNTVSVAFWNDNNEIRVGLYSSKKLKNEDYIGKTYADKITVFFYSNDKSAFRDLIDVKLTAKESNNKKDFSDAYTSFYVYKNGKLESIPTK
ncbi:hypothetical protein ACQKCJ_04470 [Flavobacterium sp. NPDC079362]|uniref:hypothetical protein n=1 Tax=Flavobacterium sp. NPDC079362 TaxID=3390566 RepID=UPI003D069973